MENRKERVSGPEKIGSLMGLAFRNADILLPKKGTDLAKWSVIACDQFTSEPDYWDAVEKTAGDAPSTYNLILPEAYLGAPDAGARLESISAHMREYLDAGVFEEYKDAMVYVERTDSRGRLRTGIVGAIDLEQYDYRKGSSSPVRATEATVLERIPPRVQIRKNAAIESPHIMILIDDRENTVIEPLAGRDLPLLYDFDLMQDGGHLKGWLLGEKEQKEILGALLALADPEHFEKLYGLKDEPVLLFAMGDGNHSLATAKECWEQLKAEHPGEDLSDHPARYALAEIVNLHSLALRFQPIHRIVTQTDPEGLMAYLTDALGLRETGSEPSAGQFFRIVRQDGGACYEITKPTSNLAVGSLQAALDGYLAAHEGKIDYIHGTGALEKLAAQEGTIGFFVPAMAKEDLFPTVIRDGALPRKTFSMGHARDKRYYMECRKIR